MFWSSTKCLKCNFFFFNYLIFNAILGRFYKNCTFWRNLFSRGGHIKTCKGVFICNGIGCQHCHWREDCTSWNCTLQAKICNNHGSVVIAMTMELCKHIGSQQTTQPTNQPLNNPLKQPSNQLTKQPTNQTTNQQTNQSTNKPTSQPTS